MDVDTVFIYSCWFDVVKIHTLSVLLIQWPIKVKCPNYPVLEFTSLVN
jgi:hypothetical protein